MQIPITRIWKGRLALVGGFLVNLSVGKPYTVGNMIPYVTSYIRAYSKPGDLTYSSSTWLFALPVICSGISMFLGAIISKRLGSRWTALLGGWIMSAGMMLTALSINQSFYMVLITDGFIFGIGVGIAYAAPIACAMKWYPDNKGLACGFVLSGIGAGTCVFTQVQTAYINPQNKNPDQPGQHALPGSHDHEMYFSKVESDEILSRVPFCFMLVGMMYAVLQLLGVLLMFDLPECTKETENCDGNDTSESKEVSEAKIPDIVLEVVKEQNIQKEIKQEADPLIIKQSKFVPDIHPLKVVQSRDFYLLWFMTCFSLQGVLFVMPLYKAFGFTFIKSDVFLAAVGSVAAICNSLGRITWGYVCDKCSFRITMIVLTAMMTVLLMTLEVTRYGGKPMFFVWVCLLFFTAAGISTLLPAATSKCFGQKHITVNYGLLFSAQVTTAFISSMLATTLTRRLGYAWMFFIMGSFTITGGMLAYFFQKKINGKYV